MIAGSFESSGKQLRPIHRSQRAATIRSCSPSGSIYRSGERNMMRVFVSRSPGDCRSAEISRRNRTRSLHRFTEHGSSIPMRIGEFGSMKIHSFPRHKNLFLRRSVVFEPEIRSFLICSIPSGHSLSFRSLPSGRGLIEARRWRHSIGWLDGRSHCEKPTHPKVQLHKEYTKTRTNHECVYT